MIGRRTGAKLACLGLLAVAGAGLAWFQSPQPSEEQAAEHCGPAPPTGMVRIEGGAARLGSTDAPDDAPPSRQQVAPFRIARTEVTNAQFAAFVRATGYVTVAERAPRADDHPDLAPELLVPGSAVFMPPATVDDHADLSHWWRFVPGANWRHPTGPGSDLRGRARHPVVHVAYEDAVAYARWRGESLPTEAQWEYAARAGIVDRLYAWGDALTPGGRHMANVWQGDFPVDDRGDDGFKGASPVGCFAANRHGLHDMIGNVWEWTSSVDPAAPGTRIIKGGSFLCAPNYCARYRPGARQSGDPSLGASHIGFRTVAA